MSERVCLRVVYDLYENDLYKKNLWLYWNLTKWKKMILLKKNAYTKTQQIWLFKKKRLYKT